MVDARMGNWMMGIKKWWKQISKADIVVFFVLMGASVIFAYKTGLLICGCYFADDHEIVRLNAMINETGLFDTMKAWLSADMNLRFRPVYWIFRVLESFILGNHVILWHLVKALEIGFCAFLMYCFARKMNVSIYASVLFSVISFLGTQCAVVFRLGPQEPLALIWMFLALIFAVRCQENAGRWDKVLFLFLLTMMMGVKESFLLLAPVIVFFLCYLEWRKSESFSLKKHMGVLWKYKGILIYTILLFLLCIGIIVFYCGVDSTGYAGFDEHLSIGDYLGLMWNIWTGSLSVYLRIFFAMLLLCVVVWIYQLMKCKPQKAQWFFLRFCEILFPLYFILSQSILHAKSSMDERYLLPCVTGIFIYVMIFGYDYFSKVKWSAVLYYAGITALFLFLAIRSNIYQVTRNYATVCIHNMQMLDRVNQLTEAYAGTDTNIVISTRYGEWNMAFSAFMEELYGVHNVYSLSQTDSGDGLAYDRYVKEEEEKAGHDITDADIYIAQSEYLPQKLGENGVDVNAFSQEVFGYYIVYYR